MPSVAFALPSAAPRATLSQVWRAESLAQAEGQTEPSGFAALDAELPGGGWPVGAMTEILHDGPETFAWPLLLPALARAVAARGRPVALIGAPWLPFSPSLAAQGLPPQALLWVRSDAPAARLWACEQALRCADVAAVLAWLPQARVGELRRLQLAAAQFDSLLWVFRPSSQAGQASPARLRLRVEAGETPGMGGTGGEHGDGDPVDTLAVHLLKRRGPPLATPIAVAARPLRLAQVLAASRQRRAGRRVAAALAPLQPIQHVQPARPAVIRLTPSFSTSRESAHALDRAAVAA